MPSRADLYRLIDELPDDELEAARRQLERLVDAERELTAFAAKQDIPLAEVRADPLLRALALAPVDDEPETDDERAAAVEAKAELARGKFVTNADLRRELGW